MSDKFLIELAPNGGRFECGPGERILDAALAAGYWLPHSCRAGSCNACHLPLLSGAVRHEPPPADGQPVPAGECRTCQAYALCNLSLDAPKVPQAPGQRVITSGAKVVDVQRPSHDVVTIRLQIPAAAGFRFQAGQYASVLLKDGAKRSYSMANAPNEEGVIEWHVRRVEGGRFSTHAYDKLKVGAMLRIEGPYGDFVLRAGDALRFTPDEIEAFRKLGLDFDGARTQDDIDQALARWADMLNDERPDLLEMIAAAMAKARGIPLPARLTRIR